MEIQKVYVKTRAEFGKQCTFDIVGPTIDAEILPNPADMNDYILKSYRNEGMQHTAQLALHEVQTFGKQSKNSGMFHFEGGWPKEINPRDEETTSRFRRRVEKDDNWAPKLRKLFELMENSVRQNGAIDIYQHYFDDMIPTKLVQTLGLRIVNVFSDPEVPRRPVTAISWSPDSGSRIAVSYCFLEFSKQHEFSNKVYIWQVENPNEPYMALEPFCQCVVCEFNPRDPSVLASGHMTGQVCNWDIRTGQKPVQTSHPLLSHRDCTNSLRWLTSKTNTELFSASSDGCAMWWDTRQLRGPIEKLWFDFENPNEPNIDNAIGATCLSFGPIVSSKFMFGTDNGLVVLGSRKMKSNAEKLSVKFKAHSGPVRSIDRNSFNPMIFLTIGDWTARVWIEDTREGCLVSTPYYLRSTTGGCWDRVRCSVFYVITANGLLTAWDLLQNIERPIFTLHVCKQSLTTMSPREEGTYVAVGNMVGRVYLIESKEFFQSFDRKDRAALSEYIERRSKVTKAVDVRLREIRLAQKIIEEETEAIKAKDKFKAARKTAIKLKEKDRGRESGIGRERRKSVSKERKRRDDSPQLLEAEQKYFEMVQKGLEMYASESDLSLRPAPQQAQPKKDRRHRRTSASEDESSGDKKKDKKKGKKKQDKRERQKSKQIQLKKKQSRRLSSRFSEGLLSERDSAAPFSKQPPDEAAKKKKKKERKAKISFSLPVPCKGEICKPKICCWRKDTKEGGRGKSRAKAEDRKASIESVEWATVKMKKPYGHKQRIRREMEVPPWELKVEVARARKEIKEMTARKMLKAPFVRETSEISMEQMWEEPKQKDRRKPEVRERQETRVELEEDKEEEGEEERVEEEQEERKKSVVVDPCVLPKVKSITEEFSTIFGPSIKKADKKKADEASLDKDKLAQIRMYPRISEYHGPVE